jgi:hypothetical protein
VNECNDLHGAESIGKGPNPLSSMEQVFLRGADLIGVDPAALKREGLRVGTQRPLWRLCRSTGRPLTGDTEPMAKFQEMHNWIFANVGDGMCRLACTASTSTLSESSSIAFSLSHVGIALSTLVASYCARQWNKSI